MMVTAQGADHTTGNVPAFDCKDKTTEDLAEVSLQAQAICAATDSLGLCIFGRSVTNANFQLIADAVNSAAGTDFKPSFFEELGYETLKLEWEFNRQAGFTEADDELPAFFYSEPLSPSGKTARHHGPAVNKRLRELLGAPVG
jgi:aldehyde:ferredoxin oxidoreductase